jgi:exosortase/archaeosortase family protein
MPDAKPTNVRSPNVGPPDVEPPNVRMPDVGPPDAAQSRPEDTRISFWRSIVSSGVRSDIAVPCAGVPCASVLCAGALCAGVLLAGWPVLRWFAARLGDGGDERFGLVALTLALVLTPRAMWRERVASWRLLAAGALVLLPALPFAGLPFAGLPMLARALLMVSALALLFCRGAGAPGRAGLLALALPVTATLQFFAGYPLRVLTAELGRPLLTLFGVATERAGVALTWSGGMVVVDAPCSGVHMLWTGGVLVCAIAAWLRLGAWRTFALGAAGLIAILPGNAVRAAVLFFIESGLWNAPEWAHEGVGLTVFAALAAGVLWLGLRLKGRACRAQAMVWRPAVWQPMARQLVARQSVVRQPPVEPDDTSVSQDSRRSRKHRPACVAAFVAACATAALLPLAGLRVKPTATDADFPGWPEMFEGKPWIRLRKPETAATFASGFSGQTAVFKQTGNRIVVMRWIREASCGVHPAADCFRASGYAVRPGGLVRDTNGLMWAEFFATRNGGTWRVRERWHDGSGGTWTDVSAWYWSAVRGGGPWWAVTVAGRAEGE